MTATAYIQQWTDSKGASHYGGVQPLVNIIIEAIGLDATVKLIMAVGGTSIYIASDPKEGAMLERAIGADACRKLAIVFPGGPLLQIPLAPKFLARHFCAQGLSNKEIARQLRRSTLTISKYLKPDDISKRALLKQADRWEGAAATLRTAAQE